MTTDKPLFHFRIDPGGADAILLQAVREAMPRPAQSLLRFQVCAGKLCERQSSGCWQAALRAIPRRTLRSGEPNS
jgi:hypothetical protein